MHAIEMLAEPDEIGVVGERAGPAAALAIGTIGRPPDRREGNAITAKPEIVVGIAHMNAKFRWGARNRSIDEIAANPHPLIGNQRAGAAQELACFRLEHIHALLFEETQRGEMDRFELINRDK